MDLREQIQQISNKINAVEQQRNEYRNKLQYMQLKAGVNTSKKDKNNSNTSFNEDTINMGLKQTNKRLQIRIG